jgi:hypothetical protein
MKASSPFLSVEIIKKQDWILFVPITYLMMSSNIKWTLILVLVQERTYLMMSPYYRTIAHGKYSY